MKQNQYTLKYLADYLELKFIGNPESIIDGIGSLYNATDTQLSFLQDSNYKKYLATTKAVAIIIKEADLIDATLGNFIIANDPYLAYAKISRLFDDAPSIEPGIHATVIIGKNCRIDESVSIGPYCVIGNNVSIGKNSLIGPGVILNDEVIIGENSKLSPNVTLYHKVRLGKRSLIHSGAVIGSDGFGNANERGVWVKIYQLGTVIIGDDVEIGANTTIDRGAIDNTVIGNGVRIDNQVQIGHNVRIGDHTAIAGCVGIAGSTKIGKYCMLGGGVGVNGHIEIADRVIITGGSNVAKSIAEQGGIYASGIPAAPHLTWWRVLSRLMKLDEVMRRLKELEKKSL